MNIVVLPKAEPTFDDFWKLAVIKKDKPLCRSMFEQIISDEGFHTVNVNKESGQRFKIHLKATAAVLIEGMKLEREERIDPSTFRPRDFTRHTSTWLNRGGWEQ